MRAFVIATLLLGAAGCAVGRDFKRPDAPATQSYLMTGDAPAAPNINLAPSAATPTEWWTAFDAPDLDRLVTEALANNRTLAQADANLEAARASASAARGGALPQLSGQAGAVRERINTQAFGFTGFPSPTLSLYSVGTSVNFDLDLFGAQRRTIEREDARVAAQQARVDAAYLTVSGNVVREAVLVAGLRAKIAAQDEIVAGDQHILEMVRRAIEVGGQPPAAATTIEAQLAEDESAGPALRQQLAEARHRLALYVGQAPGAWTAPDLDLEHFTVPDNIPVFLPSDFVRRRPDILAAEADLHAATANIGVETAALYPNITIGASLLQSAIDPASLFEGSSAGWNVGPSLTAPIFHGGEIRARVRGANAAARASLAAYEETVLEAFVQVADVMQAVGNDQEAISIQQRALDAATSNARNAQLAYDNGAGTLLSVVDAQRQANRARLASIDAQVQLHQNIAALFVAAAADWRKPDK